MALSINITPGKVFAPGELLNNAKLNQLGQPVGTLTGVVDTSVMSPADYSAVLAAGPYCYGLDTGTASDARVTLAPAPGGYVDGMLVAFKVAAANTGPCTLNVNNLGAKPVRKNANLELVANDWKQGQIVVCRYQLDGNIVPADTTYSGGGSYVLTVVPGQIYFYTLAGNDISLVNGAQTLLATGQFTAAGATVTLNGVAAGSITASVVPNSNVWQMLSQLGNPPAVVPTDPQLQILKSLNFI